MKKTGMIVWGVFLVLAGVALILAQQSIIDLSWNIFWPCILIVISVLMHIQVISGGKDSAGLLVPGGILACYGTLFLLNSLFGWYLMQTLWPVFILGPAVGLAELKLFGNEGSWIPVLILTGIGGFFLANNFTNISFVVVLAGVLILSGLILMLSQFRPSQKNGTNPAAEDTRYKQG